MSPRTPLRSVGFALVTLLACDALAAPAAHDGIAAMFRDRPTSRHYAKYPGSVPAAGKVVVDGQMDEACWDTAFVADDFILHQEALEPAAEVALADQQWRRPKFATRCLVLHDATHLYLGVTARTPPGKAPYPNYGVWPSRDDFDNTEFVGFFIDRGLPFTYDQRGTLTMWRSEYYVLIDWQGKVIDARIPGTWVRPDEDWSSGVEARVQRDAKGWTLEARIPLAQLAGDANPHDLSWLLNAARVTGDPRQGVPLRASSWTGTFHSKALPRRLRLTDRAPDVEIMALSLGRHVAGAMPGGGKTARTLVHCARAAAGVRLRHRIKTAAGEAEALDREVTLKRGLNRVDWQYTAPAEAYENRISLWQGGAELSSQTISCHPAPALLLYRRNWKVTPPESIEACADIAAPADKTLEIVLRSQDRVIASRTLAQLPKPIVDFTIPLPVPYPKPGKYQLRVTLYNRGRQAAVQECTVDVLPPRTTAAKRERIRLIHTSLRDSGVRYPVTTGIPFPVGVLHSVDGVKLVDDAGNRVPCEMKPIGWWSRRGSIRWVRLNFVHDPKRQYFIETGRAGRPPRTGPAIRVADREGSVEVDTGPMRFAVSKSKLGLQSLSINGQPARVGPAEFYAVDEGGVRYSSTHGESRSAVEEAGPLKAILKATGSCRASDGTELLRYVVRLTAYAGEPFVRVDHTFIITGDTRLHRLRTIGFDLGLRLPGATLDAKADGTMHSLGALPQVQATQIFWDRGEIRSRGKTVGKATGLDGVFRFTTPQLSCALALRRFRELCPLGISQRADGSVELLLWPEGVPERWPGNEVDADRIIHLPFPHQGPLLDFNIPREYQKVADQAGARCRGYMWSGTWNGNAMGAARTHSFVLSFGRPGGSGALRKAEAFLAYPHVSANPEWMCRSEVVGFLPMLPRTPEHPDPLVRGVEETLDRCFAQQTECLEGVSYGKWNWGRLNQQYDSSAKRWSLWRVFMNTHNEAAEAPWMLFLRSGDPKHLEFARAHTNHSVDLGWAHYADIGLRMKGYYGKIPGAVCDYKGYVPWSSGARDGYNWYADFVLHHYHLTGNMRAKDLADEIYHYLLAQHRGNGGGRSGATRLETAIHLYYETHDGRILPFIYNHFDTKLREQSAKGFVAGGAEFANWLSGYHQLTGDDRAVEFGRRLAQADVREPWWYSTGGKSWQPSWEVSAFAYHSTGDPELLRPMRHRLQERARALAGWGAIWSFLESYAGYALYAIDRAGPELEPLAPTRRLRRVQFVEDTWLVLTAATPEPGETQVTLRLAGEVTDDVNATVRVVAQDAAVLTTKPLPKLAWTLLGLSNPPIEPETFELTVDTAGHPGPFRLEAKGKGTAKLLLPESLTLFAEGKFGQGVLLNSLSRTVAYPRKGNLNPNEGTIEIWFKPLWISPEKREKDQPYFYNYLFDTRDERYRNGFQIYFWESGKKGARKSLLASGPMKRFSAGVTWQERKWRHIAFAWTKMEDHSLAKIFVDGKCVATKKAGLDEFPTECHDRMILGHNARRDHTTHLNGIMDSIRISGAMREAFDLDHPPRKEQDTLFLATFEGTLKPDYAAGEER